jgi:hypothetical protein
LLPRGSLYAMRCVGTDICTEWKRSVTAPPPSQNRT